MSGFIKRTLIAIVAASFALLAVQPSLAIGLVQEPAKRSLTPLQLEIEKQQARLSSGDTEDRREALVRLRSLQHPDASRAALTALNDPAAIVRTTAAAAVLSLPLTEVSRSLIPLLSDKDEFVRQQVAYALGRKGNTTAIPALIELLADKRDSVRGAAAVALGQIGDAQALPGLLAVLNPPVTSAKKKKAKPEPNFFVLRAVAHSLGQIGRREASPTLIGLLQDEKAETDLRREAAIALGEIGDEAALPVLRSVLTANDPHLSQSAFHAIKRISANR